MRVKLRSHFGFRIIFQRLTRPTANKILASERLFRVGIVSELTCAAEFVFLLWVLYRLLGPVNKTHASLMVILGLLQIPIMFVNALNEIAALAPFARRRLPGSIRPTATASPGHAIP